MIVAMLFQLAACNSFSDRTLKDLPTFRVASSSIGKNGDWAYLITNTSMGENITPALNWEAVDGAEEYVIYMLDETADNWVHWKAIDIHTNSLPEGWGKTVQSSEYIGPYPPKGQNHTYTIYIFALKNRIYDSDTATPTLRLSYFPGSVDKKLDVSLDRLIYQLDMRASDQESGNILAYGKISATYMGTD